MVEISYFPTLNATDIRDLLSYVNNITSFGYGSSNPIPVLGYALEFVFFMILFAGMVQANVTVEKSFGASSFSTFIFSIFLFSFGLLPGIGVVVPFLMTITSVFIIK